MRVQALQEVDEGQIIKMSTEMNECPAGGWVGVNHSFIAEPSGKIVQSVSTLQCPSKSVGMQGVTIVHGWSMSTSARSMVGSDKLP